MNESIGALADSATYGFSILDPTVTLQVSESADGGVLVEGLGALALGLCFVHNDDTDGQWTRQALKQVIEHRIGVCTS